MKIELNEEHVKVLVTALEVYSRLRLGQFDIALTEAFIDKRTEDGKMIRWTDVKKIESDLKQIFFPELYDGMSYGIGRDKDGDIAYEISSLIRQYQACKKHVEPVSKDDFIMSKPFGDPLDVSGIPHPKILEDDYKHLNVRITQEDVIEAFRKEDYRTMWDLIDEYGYPGSSHSVVKDFDDGIYLVLQKPAYYKK